MIVMMKKIIILFTISLLIISCERKTETLGPNLSDIYGGFQVFEDFEALAKTINSFSLKSEKSALLRSTLYLFVTSFFLLFVEIL